MQWYDYGTKSLLVCNSIEWRYITNLRYQRLITLSPATSQDNYQVKVELTTSNFDYSKVKADGGDVRFYQADQTPLDYWIETWNTSGTSTIWVEVATSGTSTIYMRYGGSSLSSASNGDETFEFFDDFEGTSLDTNKWTVDGAISYPVAGSILTVTDAPSSTWDVWKGIHASINNRQGVRVEAKGVDWVHASSDLFQWGVILGEQSTGNRNLGMWIRDGNTGLSFTISYYNYDTNNLNKDDIEGQQPVDLIAQRDQSGNCKFFKNGVEQQAGTEVSTNTIDTVMLLVNRYGSYAYPTMKIDKVFVHKYISPETTTTVGNETW